MTKRIIAAGLGGIAGLVIWFVMANPMDANSPDHWTASLNGSLMRRDRGFRIMLGAGVAAVVAGGAVALYAGERLRILPTQEQVDEASKPVSLFRSDRE